MYTYIRIAKQLYRLERRSTQCAVIVTTDGANIMKLADAVIKASHGQIGVDRAKRYSNGSGAILCVGNEHGFGYFKGFVYDLLQRFYATHASIEDDRKFQPILPDSIDKL